jgi:hypothetical protein
MIEHMWARVSQVIVAVVLLICVGCPLLEMFDQWDHTLQTGNDTEYALVVLALCVGVAFAIAKLTTSLLRRSHGSYFAINTSCAYSPIAWTHVSDLLFSAVSPPLSSLRI